MGILDRADAFIVNSQNQTFKKLKRCGSQRHRKGGSKMLTEIATRCFAFLILVMLGCFAAGASEITSERAERKRIEREIRAKYGRTY